MTGGGTMGMEQVHYNRDLLRGNHSRWGMCPWCPPGSATYDYYKTKRKGRAWYGLGIERLSVRVCMCMWCPLLFL